MRTAALLGLYVVVVVAAYYLGWVDAGAAALREWGEQVAWWLP